MRCNGIDLVEFHLDGNLLFITEDLKPNALGVFGLGVTPAEELGLHGEVADAISMRSMSSFCTAIMWGSAS